VDREAILSEIQRLEKEIAEKKERLAALRKSFPARKVKNYQFFNSDHRRVTLSDLFGNHHELIVVHNMGKSCSHCTMWADGFNGVYHHIIEKCAFVVATPDPPEVQNAFAAERRWQFPMISTRGTTFKEDFGFAKDGTYYPGVSTFQKDADGNIFHIADAPFGPGDDYCVVWHLFDLLPSGSQHFHPKRKINKTSPFDLTNNIAIQVRNYAEAVHFYKNTIGMTVMDETSGSETKFSFGGQNFYVENNEKEYGNVCFELAVEDFQRAIEALLKNGCRIAKTFGEKSVLIDDPYGMKFHLFESV